MNSISRISSTFTRYSREANSNRRSMAESFASKRADTVNLKLILSYDDFDTQELPLQIHTSRDVSDLYSRTQVWMMDNFNFMPQMGQEFNLLYRNKKLDRKASLKESGITEDGAKIYV